MYTEESYKKIKEAKAIVYDLDIDHDDNVIRIMPIYRVENEIVYRYLINIDLYDNYKFIYEYIEYLTPIDFNSLDIKTFLLNKIKSLRDNLLFI